MKNIYSLIATALLVAGSANAQTTQTVPNRMIINSLVGQKAYAIDQVGDITFAHKDGEVKANVEVLGYTKSDDKGDVVTVKVTRTDENSTFKIDVLPTNTVKQYDATTMARYFAMQTSSPTFSDDFTAGELSGFSKAFASNTSYSVVTLAYDEYGVPCEMATAEFTTPKVATIGTPSVTFSVDNLTSSSATITVTPNADCYAFYWCEFPKGGAEAQFATWGPMFNLANIGEMIKQFSGKAYVEATTNTWSDLAPGTDYEVMVLPVDENDNFGDLVPVYFTTKSQGGDGIAQVDINVGKYVLQNDYKLQSVTFTPNDQTSMFRDVIIEKSNFDKNGGDDWAVSYLQTEYDIEISDWNHYTTDVYTYEATPNTTYYAIAMAKNAKGEWGPLVKKEYTTPASASAAAPAHKVAAIPQRIVTGTKKAYGVAPQMKTLRLVQK